MNDLLSKALLNSLIVGGLALVTLFIVVWRVVNGQDLGPTDMMLLTFLLTLAAAATGVRLNGALGTTQEMHKDAEAVRATQLVQHASDIASTTLSTATKAASTVLASATEAAKAPPVQASPPKEE